MRKRAKYQSFSPIWETSQLLGIMWRTLCAWLKMPAACICLLLCDPLPAPSSLGEINPAAILKDFEMESAVESAFVNMVLVDMTEYARQHSDKAVKKTLSIPMWLNTLCEEKSINFSKVLQDALLTKVQSL